MLPHVFAREHQERKKEFFVYVSNYQKNQSLFFRALKGTANLIPMNQQSSTPRDGKLQGIKQLEFQVVSVTGQDPDHPKEELDRRSPDTRGWQSQKNCHYPQQLILKLISKNQPVELSKIEFLSHQSKIATKVEIVVAVDEPSSFNHADISFDQCQSIRRLGYVSLDSNERSQFQARELKSINISPQRVMFVKFILHDCWKNDLNPCNQVGIISVQLLGSLLAVEKALPASDNLRNVAKKTNPISLHPTSHENTPVRARIRPSQAPSFKLHPDIQARIDSLEQRKKDRAKLEDFDGASKLKDMLKDVRNNFTSALQIESKMHKAAADEDYVEASSLKLQRDLARKNAMEILEEAERSIPHEDAPEQVQPPFAVPCQPQDIDSMPPLHPIELPSPSNTELIRKCEPPSPIILDTSFSAPRQSPDRSNSSHTSLAASTAAPLQISKALHAQNIQDSTIVAHTDRESSTSDPFELGKHPLDGVPGFQDLPLPEDISDTRISSEVLSRVESVVGLYRTKCFFSRNWNLRDAVLTKLSLMLHSIDIEGSALALCIILERAIHDCVVQVFLTGLIVLDECLSEFENLRLTSKTVIPIVEKITIALVGKLCDNKPKVSDGAATALLSFALSQCIGPVYIGIHALKNMRPQDAKAGRAVCARLKFLEKLVDEFGDEAFQPEKVINFIKNSANGFSHKDADVRTAAKDLTTAVYRLIGEDVLFMLDGLSAKQLQEYKASFGAVRQYNPTAFGDPGGKCSISSALDTSRDKPGASLGRGRGRRRPSAAYRESKYPESSSNSAFEKNRNPRRLAQFDCDNDDFGQDDERLDEGSIAKDGTIINTGAEGSENSFSSQSSVSSFS